KYVMLVTALLNIVLSIILGTYFGLSGILAANFVAKVSTYFWYEPIVLFKEYFNRRATKYFVDHGLNIGLIIGTLLTVNWVLPKFTEKNIVVWFLEAIICLIVINLVYLGRYAKTNEFQLIFNRLKTMLGKKHITKSVTEE